MEQVISPHSHLRFGLPWWSIGTVRCFRKHLHRLRGCVSSSTNASLHVVQESTHAAVVTSLEGLHSSMDALPMLSMPLRSLDEGAEMQRFCLVSDNELFRDDNDQSFLLIEDRNECLSGAWFDNVNHHIDAASIDRICGGIAGISEPKAIMTCDSLRNGHIASFDIEQWGLQYSPGQEFSKLCTKEELGGPLFLDQDDGISVVQVLGRFQSACESSRFQVLIPKHKMKSMPQSPNDFILPLESTAYFSIEARVTTLKNPQDVDDCIEWLLQDNPDGIALVCKHGMGGSLGLIQLSTHQRCILIKAVQPGMSTGQLIISLQLRALMLDSEIIKAGANIQRDVLALYHYLGITTNSCVRISQFVGTKKKKSLLDMCRELFQWDWSEKRKVSCSNWTSKELSLEQVRYAVLEAWTTRLVWIGQSEFWHIQLPVFSLGDLPWMLLEYFGRSVFCFEARTRKDDDTSVEIKGANVELYQGYLSLKQKNFRSRVMGQKSVVEIFFKDSRKPQKYITLYREGNRVILDNAEPLKVVKSVENLLEEISMISKVLVNNSHNCDVQKQKLEESLYVLLCIPGACPRHILVALGCLNKQNIIIPNQGFRLKETDVQKCMVGLNPGQLEAWQHMLLSPLSAIVGPPGTGKTTVIAAVARAWLHMAVPGETLICSAHQNVAVRHMAETMVKGRLPGLLLLVSEDFYVGWHEDEYLQDVREALVVSGSQAGADIQNWLAQNGTTPPRIVLCTLSLIGNDSFHASLMGNRVSAMIIDECSQAAEGSLIPALGSLPHLQMLSVVGDPCQLPPYGRRPIQSVFDLLAQSCNVKQLQEQYRMPYRIAQFVSSEFYSGKLRTDPNRKCQDSDSALLWVKVKGTVDTTAGTSLSNQEEAEAVVDWCKTWKKAHSGPVPKGNLVVLTLYEAQRTLISGMLGEEGIGEEVIVYNADSFQGQEAETVIISLVVGARVSGFAADRRRACVLLSRARQGMLLFGNFDAIQGKFSSGSSENIWMTLARYCQSNGWVVSKSHAKLVARELGKSLQHVSRLQSSWSK